ncbi:MAG: tetratricopeptide repeat protein [Cyclobacteriaceae bacterium]
MNEQDMELIERYLNDELNELEKQQAEQRLITDHDFRQRLEIFREYRQMHSPQAASFRQLLDEVQAEYLHEQRPTRKYWLIAASVSVLCILAAVFFFMPGPSAEPQALYAQYFDLPADNLTVRGEEERQAQLNEAMAYYNDQQFEQAIVTFENWQQQNNDSIPVLFYKAMSHMALEEISPAITQLEKITGQPGAAAEYLMPARWYLALAYLKTGNQEKARELLEELSADSGSYAEKADGLLKEL